MPEKERIVRRSLHFYGTVQGVGFRYRARAAAEYCGLTGWVENCDDGSVLMEVQGRAASVRALPDMIARGSRWIEITGVETIDLPLVENERGFQTRGW